MEIGLNNLKKPSDSVIILFLATKPQETEIQTSFKVSQNSTDFNSGKLEKAFMYKKHRNVRTHREYICAKFHKIKHYTKNFLRKKTFLY